MRLVRFFVGLCVSSFLFLIVSQPVHAADFVVNDAASLIAAINTANSNNQPDTIFLTSNITLNSIDNITEGNNGLPSILPDGGNALSIEGNGFSILRAVAAPDFRFFHISTSASLNLYHLTLSNGSATDNVDVNSIIDNGGAVFNRGGTVYIANSTLTANFAAGEGGAIANDEGSTLTVVNSTISANSVIAPLFSGGNGGGISNKGAIARIESSVITNNTSKFAGGGIFNRDTLVISSLTIDNSTISNNRSTDSNGGGMWLGAGNITISNSTISGNTAPFRGGGILNRNAILQINNSTITDNTANVSGSGFLSDSTGNSAFRNTIIAGNTSQDCTITSGVVTTNNNNLLGTNGSGSGCPAVGTDLTPNTTIGSILAALANNGSATPTHALVLNSPAIDASGIGATGIDQRGASAVNTRDIGAYESDGLIPTVSFSIDELILQEAGAITQAIVTISVSNYLSPFGFDFTFIGTADTSDYATSYAGAFSVNGNGTRTFTMDILTDALTEVEENLSLRLYVQGAAQVSGTNPQVITLRDNTTTTPLFSKAFAPGVIQTNTQSTLTFTINNSANAVDATGLDFTDNLPAGMEIANPSNTTTSCNGGTLTAVPGSGTVSYTGATVTAGASCTLSVDVTGTVTGTLVNVSGDLTSSAGNSGTATASLVVSDTPIVGNPPQPDAQEDIDGGIGIFDPAISKLGFLVPGQTGVASEQLEWVVTVSNTGAVVGNNVTITDTLIDALRVDSVTAPGATVNINGQTVSVTYPALNVGQTVQFSIFTTVLEGVEVNNTACVNADNQGAEECATGAVIATLPQTGESPFWRNWWLWTVLFLVCAGFSIGIRHSSTRAKNE